MPIDDDEDSNEELNSLGVIEWILLLIGIPPIHRLPKRNKRTLSGPVQFRLIEIFFSVLWSGGCLAIYANVKGKEFIQVFSGWSPILLYITPQLITFWLTGWILRVRNIRSQALRLLDLAILQTGGAILGLYFGANIA